jgi:hypothetical protein
MKLGLGLSLANRGGAGPSSPIPLAGLSLWLKPDSGLNSVDGIVTQWTDQSSSGNNFSQDIDYLVFVEADTINGYDAVLFDGGRLNGDSDIVTAKTIYAVVRTFFNFQVEAFAAILECTGGSLYSAVSDNEWGSYFNAGWSAVDTLSPNTSSIIATISNDGETFEYRRDGQSIFNGTNGGGFYSRSASYLGNDGGGGQPANVYLSELIVYDRVPTSTEIQQIEAYLNAKYAIYVPFSETGAFWQSCPAGGCNNVTTPSGWNVPADSIHTYTDNKMQFNSAGDEQTTFTHTYFFPYTADSTSPYNGNGWPGVQFQPRIGLPATPVFDGGSGSMCRITWNNMVIFEQIDGEITKNMGYYYNGNATSILQELYSGYIPYSYAQTPATIPDTYFMNFKIESVNSSLEFEIGFLWD